jgi:hypothetical protein
LRLRHISFAKANFVYCMIKMVKILHLRHFLQPW